LITIVDIIISEVLDNTSSLKLEWVILLIIFIKERIIYNEVQYNSLYW
jgi:hypothetical protein